MVNYLAQSFGIVSSSQAVLNMSELGQFYLRMPSISRHESKLYHSS